MPGVIAQGQAKARKPTKNEQRRAKKKQDRAVRIFQQLYSHSELPLTLRQASATPAPATAPVTPDTTTTPNPDDANANRPLEPVEPAEDDAVQDVPAVVEFDLSPDDPLYAQFASVFAKFKEQDKEDPSLKEPEKDNVYFDDENDNIQDEEEEAAMEQRLSKKARKAANKLSIAELKAIVRKPEVVEWNDVSSSDPRLLVNIKSSRNVVPVPSHWSLKREYLSSKRGVEKAGFALPKFIAETGIADMRDAVLEKNASWSFE